MGKNGEAFERLVQIMDELREKCPWDRKQTIQSLSHLSIEELYELVDAIYEEDYQGIKEELGDLMLHLVFYAKIAREQNAFTLDEMINAVCDKLIHRHPHIYGDVQVSNEEDVKRNWEKLKIKEGKKSVLQGVPKSLPAIVKAVRIQEKSKQVGFEWENTGQVMAKVDEELGELKEAVANGDAEHMEEELGDLLFSVVNLSRFINTDPEAALERTNKKFIQRFQAMEEIAMQRSTSLAEMSLQEMDDLWNKVKAK